MRARHAIVVVVALMSVAGIQGQQNPSEDAEVMRALDAFIEGWNSRDASQYAAALHFPHVILEAGTPSFYPEEREFVARGSAFWSSVQPDWHHSVWEDRRIVQKLPNVVHVAGRWARLDKSGKVIGRADVLYVVAKKQGRWAIAARSGSRGAQGALKSPGQQPDLH
jgi:hypothetical protein